MSVTVRPDVETAVIRFLSSKDSIRAVGKADRIGKSPMVVVRATGGEVLDPRRSVHQISVSCWGVTPQDDMGAYRLAARVLQLLEELPIDGWVGKYPCHNSRVAVAHIPTLTHRPVSLGILLLFGYMWPVLPFKRRNNGCQ